MSEILKVLKISYVFFAIYIINMNTSLILNNKNQLALFYSQALEFTPEWASIDVEQGEIYVGGEDVGQKAIKLDTIDKAIYERVQYEADILLIRVENDATRTPREAHTVPLMISTQI